MCSWLLNRRNVSLKFFYWSFFYLECSPLFFLSLMFNWLGNPRRGFHMDLFSFLGGIKRLGSEACYCQRAFYFLPQWFQVFSGGPAVPKSEKKMALDLSWNHIYERNRTVLSGAHSVSEHLPTLHKVGQKEAFSFPAVVQSRCLRCSCIALKFC